MKILITLVLLLVGITTTTFAQDFIVLKTGSEIKSKIVELTPKEIKYKAFDNLDGPVITIDRTTVFMCRYANGKTELITQIEPDNVDNQTLKKEDNPPIKKVETPKIVKNEAPQHASVSQLPQLQKEPKASEIEQNTGFTGSVFIGGSLPYGNYASADLGDDEKAAGAKLGLIGGVQVGYRINKNYSLLCEAQVVLNSYDIKVEDARYIYSLKGDWTHIAVMPGFKTEIPLTNNISIYSIASAGVSFASVKGDFANVLKVLDSNTQSTCFGYSITAGLIFNKSVNLGIKTFDSSPSFGDFKPTVSTLQVIVGYQF